MTIVRGAARRRGRDVGLSRADADAAPVARHGEAGQGVERGSALGRARAQIEAPVVPRAADGVAHDGALGERTAVVRAGRAHGQHVAAAPNQQHGLAGRVPEQRRVRAERLFADPRREIRPGQLALVATHVSLE